MVGELGEQPSALNNPGAVSRWSEGKLWTHKARGTGDIPIERSAKRDLLPRAAEGSGLSRQMRTASDAVASRTKRNAAARCSETQARPTMNNHLYHMNTKPRGCGLGYLTHDASTKMPTVQGGLAP